MVNLKSQYNNTSSCAVAERPRDAFCPSVVSFKGKGKSLDTCYSATYMSQTRDQQHFTISEVAADWHEPMVPQRIMWPSIARARDN